MGRGVGRRGVAGRRRGLVEVDEERGQADLVGLRGGCRGRIHQRRGFDAILGGTKAIYCRVSTQGRGNDLLGIRVGDHGRREGRTRERKRERDVTVRVRRIGGEKRTAETGCLLLRVRRRGRARKRRCPNQGGEWAHPMRSCVRRPRRDVWVKASRRRGGSLVFGIGKGMRKREHRGDGRACGLHVTEGNGRIII